MFTPGLPCVVKVTPPVGGTCGLIGEVTEQRWNKLRSDCVQIAYIYFSYILFLNSRLFLDTHEELVAAEIGTILRSITNIGR